jgi:hypothetical protein
MYYLELLHASEDTLSLWSRLHLQSLGPTNPHWARVVGYGPFSLCVIHKEGLYPSRGGINRLVMMMMMCLLPYAKLVRALSSVTSLSLVYVTLALVCPFKLSER